MCMKFLMNKKLDLEQLDKIRLLQRSYSAICEVNKKLSSLCLRDKILQNYITIITIMAVAKKRIVFLKENRTSKVKFKNLSWVTGLGIG